ncbi:helix-turn-helix domain-containing protein [Planctomicrobium piriforme]|uniref:helix-turn-helix domain-containing protein n=1 Tax=Planctomicrobium piriforme TaxID=1576369 RepID=UPI000B845CBD|nr:helix-turn-helix transcriptional regulator [Planctomicrobium piriforme]
MDKATQENVTYWETVVQLVGSTLVIRFKIRELLMAKEHSEGRRIALREVAERTGISPQVLSSLCSPTHAVVTNTAFVESLCRFFDCTPNDLMVMVDADDVAICHVDALYPDRRR